MLYSTNVGVIVQQLKHADAGVRGAAVNALSSVDRAGLAAHVPAIVQRLEDVDADVRRAAVDALSR
eukprot:5085566-Prymnesium_polylepis.1